MKDLERLQHYRQQLKSIRKLQSDIETHQMKLTIVRHRSIDRFHPTSEVLVMIGSATFVAYQVIRIILGMVILFSYSQIIPTVWADAWLSTPTYYMVVSGVILFFLMFLEKKGTKEKFIDSSRRFTYYRIVVADGLVFIKYAILLWILSYGIPFMGGLLSITFIENLPLGDWLLVSAYQSVVLAGAYMILMAIIGLLGLPIVQHFIQHSRKVKQLFDQQVTLKEQEAKSLETKLVNLRTQLEQLETSFQASDLVVPKYQRMEILDAMIDYLSQKPEQTIMAALNVAIFKELNEEGDQALKQQVKELRERLDEEQAERQALLNRGEAASDVYHQMTQEHHESILMQAQRVKDKVRQVRNKS